MAENIENNGCSQRDNAEHEGYVKASRSFNRIWKERDSAQPRLLETILYKDNFNRAYKRVKANKGAPGIDGMTIEAVSYTHLSAYCNGISDGNTTGRNRHIPGSGNGYHVRGILYTSTCIQSDFCACLLYTSLYWWRSRFNELF